MITITSQAREYLKNALKSAEYKAISIDAEEGGCAGMQYKFAVANEFQATKEEVDFGDFKVFIDTQVLLFVIGTELDYKITATGSKLMFNNAGMDGVCSCGKSFSI